MGLAGGGPGQAPLGMKVAREEREQKESAAGALGVLFALETPNSDSSHVGWGARLVKAYGGTQPACKIHFVGF